MPREHSEATRLAASFIPQESGADAAINPSKPLRSAPITERERPYLVALGTRLHAAREAAGVSRAELADRTGLNAKTIWRIEAGTRRTRKRTLRIIASEITDPGEDLAQQLINIGGPAIALESPFVERIERRRARRLRRIQVLAEREEYAAERAALEATWAERTASHLRFRAAMRLIDTSLLQLRRLRMLRHRLSETFHRQMWPTTRARPFCGANRAILERHRRAGALRDARKVSGPGPRVVDGVDLAALVPGGQAAHSSR